MTWQSFLKWELYTRDTIDVKKIYIDISGDLIAGIMLSQILYWHLPNKDGKSKLRIFKKGKYWLCKSDKDWFEEIRISPKQARRARLILVKKGIIKTSIFRFNNVPRIHIQINEEVFISRLAPQGKLDLPPKAPRLAPQGKTLTETTTKITKYKNKKFKIPIIEKSKYEPQTPLAKQWANYEIKENYR